jgi:ArsR family transcriptional regulator
MNISEMKRSAAAAERFLKAFCNGHRLLILCSLAEEERSVGELERLLEVRQPLLSQQLARLREEGLVKTRRVGTTIFYSLGSEEARRVIGLLYELFCAAQAATPEEESGAVPPGGGDGAPDW